MGILRSTGKILGVFINFRVDKWANFTEHTENVKYLSSQAKDLFSIQQANRNESFDDAIARLEISEQDVKSINKMFNVYTIIFLGIALGLLCYSLYLAVILKNWMGTIMGFGLTIFALTNAFRYNFWSFQLKNRKLGCSLRDWFNS